MHELALTPALSPRRGGNRRPIFCNDKLPHWFRDSMRELFRKDLFPNGMSYIVQAGMAYA